MDKLIGKIDDFVTSLWIETAGLTVVMSLIFAIAINLF